MTLRVTAASSTPDDPYHAIARLYGACLDPLILPWRKKALKLIPPTPGMTILDAGCGTGVQLNLYRTRGCRVFGIDLSPGMLSVARRRHPHSLNLCRGNAARMPYHNQAFDLIVLSMMLHETCPATRSALLQESQRVLKPAGRILVIDYIAGKPLTCIGCLIAAGIRLIEWAAGRAHFTNYKDFVRSGGLPPLLKQQPLTLEGYQTAYGGNISLFLIRKNQSPN